MNIFELKIWDDEGEKCTFYTVQIDDSSENETNKFFMQYEKSTHEYHSQSNELLLLVIESIGNDYGATDAFFDRHKNRAQALPPKPKKYIPEIEQLGINFPLRLYCYRISSTIVVLFNGGIKNERTDQESPDISFKFQEAQGFARRIAEALADKTITISEDGRYLIHYSGKEIIL